MRTLLQRAALVCAVAAAGCSQDTTAPDPGGADATASAVGYDGPLSRADYFRDEAAMLAGIPLGPMVSPSDSAHPDSLAGRPGRHGPRRPGALVLHLLRRSLREHAETEGDSAARALAEPVRELLDSARVAFQGGDTADAAALVEQAFLAAAAIVIDLQGTQPLDVLTQRVDSGLVRIDALIARVEAEDRDATRLIALRDFVATLHADAAAARAAGNLPQALVSESIAAQLLGRVLHHGRGPGGHGRRRG